jgi:VWFA-related protein
MRIPASFLSVLFLTAAIQTTAIQAQQPKQVPVLPGLSLPSENTPPVKGDIALNVVVTAKNTPPLAGLQEASFTLLDNKSPVKINSFREISGAQAASKVLIVIDGVNTRYDTVSSARLRIDDFLRQNEGRLAQQTAFYNFTDTSKIVPLTFTTNGLALSKSLDASLQSLRFLNRDTGVIGESERLGLSIDMLHRLVLQLNNTPGHKIMIWISPGWPMLSSPGEEDQVSYKQQQQIFATYANLLTLMRSSDITLYSANPVGAVEGPFEALHYEEFLNDVTRPGQAELGDLALQALAVKSGGLALNEGNDLAAMLNESVSDTRDWYRITFTPNLDDKILFHKLEVKVAQPKTTARTSTGYYVPQP